MSRLLVQDPDTYVPPSSDLRGMAQRDACESPRHIDWQRIAEERQALLMAALDDCDRKRLEIDRLKRQLTAEEASHASTRLDLSRVTRRRSQSLAGDAAVVACASAAAPRPRHRSR